MAFADDAPADWQRDQSYRRRNDDAPQALAQRGRIEIEHSADVLERERPISVSGVDPLLGIAH